MKIEAGRYYKTRDGRKVGPMEVGDNGIAMPTIGSYTCVFADTGMGYRDREWAGDLVAEWEDSPVRMMPTIVGGTYGNLTVYRGASNDLRIEFTKSKHTRAELTAAIATLTTIRDALDEVA